MTQPSPTGQTGARGPDDPQHARPAHAPVMAMVALAGALASAGRGGDALTLLRCAVRLDPDNPVVTRRLAIALMDEGRADVALAVLDQMVEQGLATRADTAAFYTLRARILRRLGRDADADEAFGLATRLAKAG